MSRLYECIIVYRSEHLFLLHVIFYGTKNTTEYSIMDRNRMKYSFKTKIGDLYRMTKFSFFQDMNLRVIVAAAAVFAVA